MLPILCVGALTLDTIFRMERLPEGPGKFLPRETVDIAAGMATSAATAIARLGGKVALWASVGEDATSARLIDEISAEGVDCSNVRRVAGARSAFASIIVDAQGERIVVPQYDPALLAAPSTMPEIAPSRFAAVLADVRWPDAAEKALRAARQTGVPGVLDADTAPQAVLNRLLPLASHVVASEPAALALTGQNTAEGATLALSEQLSGFVAVTAGANGVFWVEEGAGALQHQRPPAVEAVDTLAAGDVFHGAFALGLAEGLAMPQIMKLAVTAAALKCEVFGGRRGAPSRAQVMQRLERSPF